MKILVPIYGSTPSIKALEYAIYPLKLTNLNADQSRNKHGELILIDVLPHFICRYDLKNLGNLSRLIKLFLCLNPSKK
jgi:hypothetical protein